MLAFQGLTARESSRALQCTERTVNYHLANAMGKLKVDNKMAAIQRACWIGRDLRRAGEGLYCGNIRTTTMADTDRTASLMTPAKLAQVKPRPAALAGGVA